MARYDEFPTEIPCTQLVRMAGEDVECGHMRTINAWCPNNENHIKELCGTCGSTDRTIHNVAVKDGSASMADRVCKDPWHSSSHAGREMMNKLIGHSWHSNSPANLTAPWQYVPQQRLTPGGPVHGGWSFQEYPEVSGGGVPYPTLGATHCTECGQAYPQDESGSSRATDATEPTIAGAVADEEGLPGGSGVSGRSDLGQVVLDDLGHAYGAMKRAQESIQTYTRLLAMMKDEESASLPGDAASAGKVPDSAGPRPPKHGQLATITGVPGLILVYLSDMHPVGGSGWYRITNHSPMDNLIEEAQYELDEVGHKARSDQARADFAAAQEAYDARVTLRGSEDDLTHGGTVNVSHGEHGEHGEHGGQEMPGMWDESDVRGGQEDDDGKV